MLLLTTWVVYARRRLSPRHRVTVRRLRDRQSNGFGLVLKLPCWACSTSWPSATKGGEADRVCELAPVGGRRPRRQARPRRGRSTASSRPAHALGPVWGRPGTWLQGVDRRYPAGQRRRFFAAPCVTVASIIALQAWHRLITWMPSLSPSSTNSVLRASSPQRPCRVTKCSSLSRAFASMTKGLAFWRITKMAPASEMTIRRSSMGRFA